MNPRTTFTRFKGKTIARKNGDGFAASAISGFDKNTRISGITNGKFSLISLIRAVLDITGSAHVVVSTWSAGVYDATDMNSLLISGKIKSIRMILDRSFKTRQAQYSTYITDLLTPENIRTTNTHSKFVLIWNDEWNVCIRSSMNLNENKRCENFDIDNDINVFNLFKDFADDIFRKAPPGIVEEWNRIEPVFNSLFSEEEMSGTSEDKDRFSFVKKINYDAISQ